MLGLPGVWHWLGLAAEQEQRWAGVWLLGHLCPVRGGEGRGFSWNPTKPCFGTATGEWKLCRAAPYSPCLSTFLFTLPLPAVPYGSKEITLLSKERKEKQIFLFSKNFVLTCILKTCTAQSRSAAVSQHCCRKQPRRPILYLYPGS